MLAEQKQLKGAPSKDLKKFNHIHFPVPERKM